MHKMTIRDMVFWGLHGANPDEKIARQRIKVSVVLLVDITRAAETDALVNTVNWSDLRKLIRAIVEEQSFVLIETLAWRIAQGILEEVRIQQAEVTVEKLNAWRDGNGVPGITLVLPKPG